MFIASTSSGILPKAWTASVWNRTLCARQIRPIAATSWITPVSLLAVMIETRMVSGRIAASSSARSTSPSVPTGSQVTSQPLRSRCLQVSMTALCSVTTVMMWLPLSRRNSAAPLIARLLASVAPLVKVISLASAPITAATCLRALSTASSAAQPNAWVRLAALPKCLVK